MKMKNLILFPKIIIPRTLTPYVNVIHAKLIQPSQKSHIFNIISMGSIQQNQIFLILVMNTFPMKTVTDLSLYIFDVIILSNGMVLPFLQY